jgi:fimbrial isopeptide formation D2 family protein
MAVAGLLIAVGAFFAFNAVFSPVEAATRSCSNDDVIKCGALSISELRSKYNSDYTHGTKTIYSYMGLSSNTINNAHYKMGTVYKDGRVVVDGKVVAKNAISSGRYSTRGATYHNIGGVKFYTGPTQVRFITLSSSPVFAFFDDYGRFIGAAMLGCGNAIKATNVVETPVYKCNSLTAAVIDRTTRKFTTAVTAKSGATVKNYTYDFGDGKKTTSTSSSVTHAYAPGTYTASVTVRFNVGYVEKTSTCMVKVTVEEAPNPAVKIEKLVNHQKTAEVMAGDDFEYNLKVTNTGDVALKDVRVSDEAPAGITFKSADTGSISNNVWTYTAASLAVGQSFTVTITAVANEPFADAKVNTACVDTPTVPGSPDDCDTATVTTKIKVCDTDTDTIVWISKSEADNEKYTTDLSQCENVEVCNQHTGKIITVSRNDEDKYVDVDSAVCHPKPTPKPPVTELPKTGLADTLGSVLGLGSLTAATYYYLASRRN